jgi:hypothetical protein
MARIIRLRTLWGMVKVLTNGIARDPVLARTRDVLNILVYLKGSPQDRSGGSSVTPRPIGTGWIVGRRIHPSVVD